MQTDTNFLPSTASEPETGLPTSPLLYTGGGQGEVLQAMLAAIAAQTPLLVLTGAEGSGKTTICEQIEKNISPDCVIAYFPEAVDSFDDALRFLAQAIESPEQAAASSSTPALLQALTKSLQEQQARLVIIFDQAERIFLATLERIRRMLDTVNEQGIRIQLILVGQEVLLTNLRQLRIVSFKEIREDFFTINPLDENEIHGYLQSWLQNRQTGLQAGLLPRKTRNWLLKETGGNIARINDVLEKNAPMLLAQANSAAGKASEQKEQAKEHARTSSLGQLAKKTSKLQLPQFALPKIHFPRLKLPSLTLPKFSIPKVSVPKVSMPKVSMPKVRLPAFSLPKISLPAFSWHFPDWRQVWEKTGLHRLPEALSTLPWQAWARKIAAVWRIPLRGGAAAWQRFCTMDWSILWRWTRAVRLPVLSTKTFKSVGTAAAVFFFLTASYYGFTHFPVDSLPSLPSLPSREKPSPEPKQTPDTTTNTPASLALPEKASDTSAQKMTVPADTGKKATEPVTTSVEKALSPDPEKGKTAPSADSQKQEIPAENTAARQPAAPPAAVSQQSAPAVKKEERPPAPSATRSEPPAPEPLVVKKISTGLKKVVHELPKPEPPPVQKIGRKDVPEKPVENIPPAKVVKQPVPEKAPEPPAKPAQPDASGQAYSSGLAAGERLVGRKNTSRYTVQLLSTSPDKAQALVKELLAQDSTREYAKKLAIVPSAGGANSVTLFYGDYASMTEARNARNSIPTTLRKGNPYAISVEGALNKLKERP